MTRERFLLTLRRTRVFLLPFAFTPQQHEQEPEQIKKTMSCTW